MNTGPTGRQSPSTLANATGRPPTDVELAAAESFLREQPAHYAGRNDASDALWVDLCQMVLSSNAFLYVE